MELLVNVYWPEEFVTVVSIARNGTDQFDLTFTGKLGISYQRQVSNDLITWSDQGVPIAPGDATTTVTVQGVGSRQFWRFKPIY